MQKRKYELAPAVVSRFGLACSVQGPHQERQIARRRVNEQFLLNIVPTSHIQPVHASAIELMRKVPFHALAAPCLQPLSPCSSNPPSIAIHGRLLHVLTVPFASASFRLGDIGPHAPLGQLPDHSIAVITLVRDHFFHAREVHCILAALRGLGNLLGDRFRR